MVVSTPPSPDTNDLHLYVGIENALRSLAGQLSSTPESTRAVHILRALHAMPPEQAQLIKDAFIVPKEEAAGMELDLTSAPFKSIHDSGAWMSSEWSEI